MKKVKNVQLILQLKIKIYCVLYLLIENVFDKKSAILLQNAFPTLEKYIDHIHTIDGKPAKIPEALEKIILENFKNLLKLKSKGINLFFTDIDKIKKQIKDDLK